MRACLIACMLFVGAVSSGCAVETELEVAEGAEALAKSKQAIAGAWKLTTLRASNLDTKKFKLTLNLAEDGSFDGEFSGAGGVRCPCPEQGSVYGTFNPTSLFSVKAHDDYYFAYDSKDKPAEDESQLGEALLGKFRYKLFTSEEFTAWIQSDDPFASNPKTHPTKDFTKPLLVLWRTDPSVSLFVFERQ